MTTFLEQNKDLMTDIAETIKANFQDDEIDWRQIQYEKFWDAPATASVKTEITDQSGVITTAFAPEDADDMVDELHDMSLEKDGQPFKRIIITLNRADKKSDISFNFKFS